MFSLYKGKKSAVTSGPVIEIQPDSLKEIVYECEATNKLGKISKQITVRVFGKENQSIDRSIGIDLGWRFLFLSLFVFRSF